MTTGGKSLRDQVSEIQKLIEDASETLRQANWAMETLHQRLADAPETPPEPVGTTSAPDPEPPEPAGARAPEAGPAGRRRRHRLWSQSSDG